MQFGGRRQRWGFKPIGATADGRVVPDGIEAKRSQSNTGKFIEKEDAGQLLRPSGAPDRDRVKQDEPRTDFSTL